MSLVISSTAEASRRTVIVSGEVDVSNAGELRDAIDAELATPGPTELDVDIAQVSYIDSTGIGVLVGAARRASEAGCHLSVLRPQRNVSRVLGLLGVRDVLDLQEE